MHSVILVVIFTIFCQTAVADDFQQETRILEDNIRIWTACILDRLTFGIAECEVPSFAPLLIDSGEVDLRNLGMEGHLQVDGLTLNGLTDLYYDILELSIITIPLGYKFKAQTVIDNIVGSSSYVLKDFKLDNVEAFGAGDITLSCQGLSFYIEFLIPLTGVLRVVTTTTSIKSCSHFVITGVNNDDVLSQSITDRVQSDAAGVVAELSSIINKIVIQAFNEFFEGNIDIDISCLSNGCS